MKVRMKELLIFCAAMTLLHCGYTQSRRGHRIYLSPGHDGGRSIRSPQVAEYHPGDTLVLNSHKVWAYLYIDNYKGSSSAPLVIINDAGGAVKFKGAGGIQITNSSYIKLCGTGGKDNFGIQLEGDPVYRPTAGKGIEVHMRSKNIELSHLSVHNMGFGFVCRTDNFCVDSLTYPNWVLDSISIHDCRIVGVWYEGMYIGNTSPDNAKDSYDPRPIVCNGDTVYPMPMRNGNAKVYNNYVDSTGRGGIQLASASTGISEIYNNTVKHNGLNGDTDQGTGISVGAYSHVHIHDNKVSNTFTSGIASLGGSGTGFLLSIENNKIDSSGFLRHYNLIVEENTKIHPDTQPVYSDTLAGPCSIYLGTRPTLFKDSTTFSIKDNIIGKFKNPVAAIQIFDDYGTMSSTGNIICGNKNAMSNTKASIYVENSKTIIHYKDTCP